LSYTIPVAKVEFIDESSNVYTLTPCYQFRISLRRDTPLSKFSISIAKASLWNARTASYLNLISPDVRKRIKIYIGTRTGDSYSYTLIYTGIPFKVSETYLFGQTEVIRVEGYNLAYLLQRINGTYSSTTYSGDSQGLIEYWCGQAGLSYSLTYTDSITLSNNTIAYSNALAGVLDILKVLGPNIDAYITAAGVLTIEDTSFWSEGVNDLDLDQDDIGTLSRYQELNKIITRAIVVGATTDYSISVDASAAMISVYGLNKRIISSGLITSLSQATLLANAILWHGERYTNMVDLSIQLNTDININTQMTVEDSAQSGTVRGGVRPEEIVHSFKYGQTYETNISGFFDEGSSSSSSSSSSSLSSSSSSSSSSSISSSSSSSSNSSSSSSYSSSSSSLSLSSSSSSSLSNSSSSSSCISSSSSSSISSSSSSSSSIFSISSSSSSSSSQSSSSLSSSSSSSSLSFSSSSSSSISVSSSSSSSSYSSGAACEANDQFTEGDGAPLSWRWYLDDPVEMFSIYNNKLRAYYVDSTNEESFVYSDYVFLAGAGFDIQIDFSDVQSAGNGGLQFYLGVTNFGALEAYVGMEYVPYVSSHIYYCGLEGGDSVNTTHTSGKLRLVRSSNGASITVYYWNPTSEQWEWDGNTAGLTVTGDFSLENLTVEIRVAGVVYSGSVTYSVNFDNFTVNDGCENISSLSSSSRSSSSSSRSSSSSSRSSSSFSLSSSSSSSGSSSSSSYSGSGP